jgi:hypothetical protein
VSSSVTLYRAGDEKGSGETALGWASTDATGAFRLSYVVPDDPDAVLYLIAEGPAPSPILLATVLGDGPVETSIVINERTTVATAFAMAQFIAGHQIGGTSPGLQNASGIVRNLVDVETGEVGDLLGKAPNGLETSTMRTFNSLANLLAGCVNVAADCTKLFKLATTPAGRAPHETLQAAINIAHNPWQNPAKLFRLAARGTSPYQPALRSAPDTWALAIKYVGNGREFDGPGAMAFDENGDVWATNNYAFRKNHSVPTCGSELLSKLTATGADAPRAPYRGKRGGLDGAGFGITLDPDGNLWVGNFGFFGSTCPTKRIPSANSLSKFSPSGKPLSPPAGFTQGCISGAQGTVSDQLGNIWIANACGGTITQYREGDPDDAWVFDIGSGETALDGICPDNPAATPFDIAIDSAGDAWVSDNFNDSVFKLAADGSLIMSVGGPEPDIKRPLGIAIDSLGNVWISNSRVVELEKACVPSLSAQEYGALIPDRDGACVTQLDSSGKPAGTVPCGDAGLELPWGIAVDGNDNVWVANFGGRRLSQLCGARSEHCPPGRKTGEAIAPHGYPSNALLRNTGVSIDPSGNVWVANNWLIDPVQTNPGGDGLVVFIGLAAPVKTPLIGPPQQP